MSGPNPPAPTGEREAEVRRWIAAAHSDLRAARAAARSRASLPRHAGFWAQQAAEKALKAVLVDCGIPFPWIHDLDRLRNLIPDPAAWSVTQGPPSLAALTIWAVENRYPSDGPEPDAADAVEAIAAAREVVDRVVVDLLSHGLLLSPEP
jgi:HEPN domain-containing protein